MIQDNLKMIIIGGGLIFLIGYGMIKRYFRRENRIEENNQEQGNQAQEPELNGLLPHIGAGKRKSRRKKSKRVYSKKINI